MKWFGLAIKKSKNLSKTKFRIKTEDSTQKTQDYFIDLIIIAFLRSNFVTNVS